MLRVQHKWVKLGERERENVSQSERKRARKKERKFDESQKGRMLFLEYLLMKHATFYYIWE